MSSIAIYLQLTNYRKPFEQRLVVRILLVVPMFAVTCYICLVNYTVGVYFEPIREIYEAFVIYTFYKLLVLMLGGERTIIRNAQSKSPTSHFFPARLFLRKIDISDPKSFLMIKSCILQYVWVKPSLCIIIGISSALGFYNVNDISISSVYFWVGVIYNLSVTISLYFLALFWKCLYDELKRFNPWPKFLCVKVIIFASYWQGLFIGVLNWLGAFHDDIGIERGTNLGMQIQNALLCLEMVFFAWLHWTSFPYTEFTSDKFPDAARVKTWLAFKDWISIGDLLYDINLTIMKGDSYNFRNFDSVNDLAVYNKSETFTKKIYQGLRVSRDGSKHWIPVSPSNSRAGSFSGTSASVKSIAVTQTLSAVPNQKTPLLTETPQKQYLGKLPPFLDYDNSGRRGTSTEMNRGDSFSSTTVQAESVIIDQYDPANEDLARDEKLYHYVKDHYINEDKINYPVEYDYKEIAYSNKITKMRQQLSLGTTADDNEVA
ncbi:hypothetical protein FOA43_004169 [Brettanomyces nanus]|uniref:Uncharacterized protein n=1 Tax=Eeniella nana TaxID=13502 RepID=A0A875S9F0_EENNA|nr:uncharacterized protein FOA43_004169 [Brettanomyces nanus]QPG76775.1 hypothetical protein FOA43_004169 [Brettanomyces nanus]